MAIPSGVERVTVTAGPGLTLPDGTPVIGSIKFTAPRLNVVPPDDYAFGSTAVAMLDEDGQFSIDLVPQDAEGIDPTGWTYRVSTHFSNAQNWVQFILLTQDEPEVNLADILEPVASDPDFEGLFLPLTGGEMSGPLSFATDGVDVDVQQAFGTTLSTGIISGGRLSASATPNAVDIAALVGQIVDTHTEPLNPTVTRVTAQAQTVALDAGSLARAASWFVMDSAGVVSQQGDRPGPEQLGTSLVLGAIVYDPGTETVFAALSAATGLTQPAVDWADHADALGPFRVHGLRPSANGANLSLDLEAGEIFSRSFQRYSTTTGLLTQNPNRVQIAARTAFTFFRVTRSFTGAETQANTVDPTMWDNNGTLTAVGGGSGQATIQRILMSANGLVGNDIAVQYGQRVHSTLADATAALGANPFEFATGAEGNTILVGYVIVTRTATSLADPSTSLVLRAPKFTDL